MDIHVSDRATIPMDPAAPSDERRQVSVLFADMVGFTAISERLGEEGTFAFVRIIYDKLAAVVREQGGTVRGFAGDSIMALFGVPDALEDAPLRACRAAMSIHAVLKESADEIEARFGTRPAMRVGVSSGLAVVARVEDDSAMATALGDTVNLASRLQGLAAAGTSLTCDSTRRLVEWLVDMSFAGEHTIKGKTKPQKVWRLESVHKGLTRFDASLGRGLSAYIGRDNELTMLRDALRRARDRLQVIDIVGDPGLGKTRLAFEFRQRLNADEVRVLTGNCTADGQQIPFLPFLEVVRGAFRIRPEDDPAEIARKLETGLRSLELHTTENLGLLLNLLGIEPPEGSLAGLDGVLIGLRTRDLLPALLKARCRASPVVLSLEDIHWIDGVSQEILGRMIEDLAQSNLLIITTRRPEYVPSWRDGPGVTTLRLEPMTASDIRHLLETRLGVASAPDALIRQVTERAEGNPLFGEEILSFLIQRGALRVTEGSVEFDPDAGDIGLPASLQSLLAARADRLPREDRALLQAAAAIGRRFDRTLLALVVEAEDVGARLENLHALDIVHREGRSSDYAFKHVLLRDTLYQSLLMDRRAQLHLKIAQALEKRSEGRLTEVAETLAHHYVRTDRNSIAFAYLAMAGAKSLGVYSLDEADQYFATALALFERDPTCASGERFAEMLANYAQCSNISLRLKTIIAVTTKFRPNLNQSGDSRHHVLILHHYISSLVWTARYRDAVSVQQELSAMARRLGDSKSIAYALVSELHVSTYCAPISIEAFQTRRREAEAALTSVDDAYLHYFYSAILAWDEVSRGRITEARAAVERLTVIGVSMNDPRSVGYAAAMKALIAILSDNYEAGLEFADVGIRMSRAPFERALATSARNIALVLMNEPGALDEVGGFITKCAENGWMLALAGPENLWGVAIAMNGRIQEGLRHIEQTIVRRDNEGFRACADWCRTYLCEVYLNVLSGNGKASLGLFLRNFRALSWVMMFGAKRIVELIEHVRSNPQFDPDGHYIGRAEMILGLLYKAKKKKALAASHLSEARRIASAFGPSPMLTRIEAALAELA
jgi:class 3 adenylate cyclase